MPKLTVSAVEKYRATTRRREIRDTMAPALHLIVQPSGAKSWALRFRRPDGRAGKLTLGPVDLSDTETTDEPQIGGSLTLRQARQLANQIDRKRAHHIDVIADHQAQRRRVQVAAQDRAANTFGICARVFIVAYKTKHGDRPRRWREDAALLGLQYSLGADPATAEPEIIKGGLADIWRDKPVADIDGHDVHGAIAEARKTGSDNRARKAHVALSALFGWLLRERRVISNPCAGVWKPPPPADRERVLSDSEITTFWYACDRLDKTYGALFKLLLLTGCRLREAAAMTRGELIGGTWTIPGARTKNHRPLSLPLPRLALDVIADAPVIVGSDFVFTLDGTKAAGNFSHTKQRLDAVMADIAGKPVPGWRLHDLRRTFVSGMAALGIALPVIERCVNHISGSFGGIVAVYQKHEYADEKRKALKRWALHVERLVSDKRDNVVNLRG